MDDDEPLDDAELTQPLRMTGARNGAGTVTPPRRPTASGRIDGHGEGSQDVTAVIDLASLAGAKDRGNGDRRPGEQR
jgi:hypothetical protein